MNKKAVVIFSIALASFFTVSSSKAQLPDSVRNYLDSAIYFMQEKSLYGKNINWAKVKDSALLLAKDARSIKDAFPAMLYAFKQLKDSHGMVANEDTFFRYPPHVNFDSVLSPAIKNAFLKGPKIVAGFTADNIAYLRVPSMNVQNQEAVDKRANMLRDSLCKLLAANPRGIIIDLRLNGGGNSAPMITGISPLFKKPLLGYGVDRDGNFLLPNKLVNGILADEKGQYLVNIKSNCSVTGTIPIAVLIGPATGSSGEILAVFLKQQKNVKLFGAPTAGFCNATEGFLFMEQRGYLLLTVNRIADGKKKVYNEMLVKPDVPVTGEEHFENFTADAAVLAAAKWISKKR